MIVQPTVEGRFRHALKAPLRRYLPGGARRLIAVFHWLVGFTQFGKVNFYPVEQLPWAAGLEAGWKSIRAELEGVLTQLGDVPNVQDAYGGQEKLAQDDKWKAYVFLRGPGRWDEANCARCPNTRKLLEAVPGVGHAMFSILAPHKHIPAHRGAYGGMIDCHLGLMVPEPAERCRIRVGDETASWREGRLLVFDDSHEHEVWNDTEGLRVVLLMYVIRPLPFPLSRINLLMINLVSRIL